MQYDAGSRRRWFQDEFFDLYTWQNADGEWQAFQLCYDKTDQERALRWTRDRGYRHDGVDAPEDKPGRAASAIFVADRQFDPTGIAARFESAAIDLPAEVREFVLAHIQGYRLAV